MPYCTQTDIEKLIPVEELAEVTAETGETPDAAIIAEAILKADAEIDSYLGVRYCLPLASAPDRVKSLSVDMAIYHLYSRRSVAPEVRQKKYEEALDFLREVAKGKAIIVGAAGVEAPSTSADVVEISSAERVFTRTGMRDW